MLISLRILILTIALVIAGSGHSGQGSVIGIRVTAALQTHINQYPDSEVEIRAFYYLQRYLQGFTMMGSINIDDDTADSLLTSLEKALQNRDFAAADRIVSIIEYRSYHGAGS